VSWIGPFAFDNDSFLPTKAYIAFVGVLDGARFVETSSVAARPDHSRQVSAQERVLGGSNARGIGVLLAVAESTPLCANVDHPFILFVVGREMAQSESSGHLDVYIVAKK
jgi:hypothetical protein